MKTDFFVALPLNSLNHFFCFSKCNRVARKALFGRLSPHSCMSPGLWFLADWSFAKDVPKKTSKVGLEGGRTDDGSLVGEEATVSLSISFSVFYQRLQHDLFSTSSSFSLHRQFASE